MVGDAAVGKTSFMARFVDGTFAEDYVETLGVNYMNKTIKFRTFNLNFFALVVNPRITFTIQNTGNHPVTFSVWDLGGQRDFQSMLPIVCADAAIVLYMFDLTRRTTLSNVKQWFKQCSTLNRKAFPFLVGTKYDSFEKLPESEREKITKMAKRYAKVMNSPLVFCSAAEDTNVKQIFKIVLGRVFQLMEKMRLPRSSKGAILLY